MNGDLKREVEVIKTKYPNYIPVLVKTIDKSLELSKNKFLISGDITVGQFMHIIRKKIVTKLNSSQSLYIFVNNKIPPATFLMHNVYQEEKEPESEMLIITICKENTFGKN